MSRDYRIELSDVQRAGDFVNGRPTTEAHPMITRMIELLGAHAIETAARLEKLEDQNAEMRAQLEALGRAFAGRLT